MDTGRVVLERHEIHLARAGFSAASAADGATALRLANRLLPGTLLTEILLPKLDGFHLAQRLRHQPKTRDMGIVAVTSYAEDDLRQRATEAGIDAVLHKSRSMDDIIRVLRETARNSRAAVRQSARLREEV